MAIILPPRGESHKHLGNVVILDTDDGWAEVGESEDVDRRKHWFRFQSIAIRAKEPFLTLKDARKAMITGMYYEKRKENKAQLRPPDDLIRPADLNTPLTGLNWYEAKALCELRYGRLPMEKEVDLIYQHLSQDMMPTPVEKVWTLSKWSNWSYARCGYDDDKQRWYAAEHVNLTEENQVSVFNLNPIKREGISPDTTDKTMGAIIVFDIQDKT